VQSAELALQWHFEVPAGVELPEPAAIAVFRIFQEMLSNVGRHAKARSLGIRIGVEDMQLSISVRDDGVGAPMQAFEAATSYGVLGMRERARHFGGRIEIDSRVGEGSTFCLHLPLPV
jgi:signal transduction histidine kinase